MIAENKKTYYVFILRTLHRVISLWKAINISTKLKYLIMIFLFPPDNIWFSCCSEGDDDNDEERYLLQH